MKIRYRLAEAGDDAALRRLLAQTPMPGSVAVTFEREPDYFAGMRIMGKPWQVIVAEEEGSGAIVGMLCRALQERFVNGEPRRIGYWGQLRVALGYQGRVFLRGAFEFAESLRSETPVDAHFVVIAEGNPAALSLFGGRHEGILPRIRPIARLITLGILLRSPLRKPLRRPLRSPLRGAGLPSTKGGGAQASGRRADSGFEILDGREAGMDAVLAFLRREGRAKQLYPAYDEAYFRECRIAPEDILVAARGGAIRGVAGLWDQSDCKQTVVQAYGGLIARARPLFNAAAPALGLKPLPGPGQKMETAYLSFIATAGNEVPPFDALLREACRRASLRGFAQLMLGLCEGDPLLASASKRLHISYAARLSVVEDITSPNASFSSGLDGRIPYVEIAAL